MFRRLLVSTILLLGLSACQPIDKNLEAEDSSNPHFKNAESYMAEKDYPKAAEEYEAALQANPKVAMAHYELGSIYGDKLGDQISAMYHYSKFLELRPTSDKREAVQAMLQNAEFTLATQLPNSPVANAEAFARLQSENANLRKQLEDAQARLARIDQQQQDQQTATAQQQQQQQAAAAAQQAAATAAAAKQAAAPAKTPAPMGSAPAVATAQPQATGSQPTTASPAASNASAPTEARSYTISKGDTLWKISAKFYKGDVVNGIEKIKTANTGTVDFTKPLKIGTVLVIP